MIDMQTGAVTLQYDGSNNPVVHSYTINHLTTGFYYSVYVIAVDFNDISLPTPEAVFAVCLAPTHIDSPYFISATKTSITMGWTEPDYMGGCPLLTYALYVEVDGEYEETGSAEIRDRPYIVQHTVDSLADTGDFFNFKIEVHNEIGSVISLPTRF